jgi:hypothetical protein
MDQEIIDGVEWFMQYARESAVVDVSEFGGNSLFDGPSWMHHYQRWYSLDDGRIVGINEEGYAITSDSGSSWTSQRSPGMNLNYNAKLFVGWNSNDICTWVGAGKGSGRAPAILMTSTDGFRFDTLMTPVVSMNHKKFSGNSKTSGFNYMDGPTEGFTDPMPDGHFWYCFDYNKEEIWMGQIEVPIGDGTESDPVWEDFDTMQRGAFIPEWNVHRPVWCPTDITEGPVDNANTVLRIQDRDPWDRAIAERVFPETTHAEVQFDLYPSQDSTGYASPVKRFDTSWTWEPYTLGNWMEIELQSWSHQRPVRMYLATDGRLKAVDGSDTVDVMAYTARQWHRIRIVADCGAATYDLFVNGEQKLDNAAFAENATTLERLTFRTGKYCAEDEGPDWAKIGYAACSHCGDLPHASDPVELQQWYVDNVGLLAMPQDVSPRSQQAAPHSPLPQVRVTATPKGVVVSGVRKCSYRAVLFTANGTVLQRASRPHGGVQVLGTARLSGAGVYYVKISLQGRSLVRRVVMQ